MGRLIYGMLSLDGYVEDARAYANELAAPVSTHLYGRRMYETLVYWETVTAGGNEPRAVLEWARQWQAAEKVVYSRTLAEVRSARTRVERSFEPEALRRLKTEAKGDVTVSVPELAAHALRAGLVDELQLTTFPVVVGGGKRFFPEGLERKLELVEERRFARSGVVAMRYAVRN